MARVKLTPRERERLEQIAGFERRVQQAHGLVERFAADLNNPLQHALALRRLFGQMKLQFSSAGLDSLSQSCAALEITARRGASHVLKSRILREGVVALRKGLELEARAIKLQAERAAAREQNEAAERDEPLGP